MLTNNSYFQFDTQTSCNSLEIVFTSSSNISINEIIINKPILSISSFRIIAIFLICTLINDIRDKSIFKTIYDKNSKEQSLKFTMFILIIFFLLIHYMIQQSSLLNLDQMDSIYESDFNLYEPAVHADAILNGSSHLLVQPDNSLKELDDPYNYDERQSQNIPYLYDTAYYNDHYYSYFGIAPIITSIIPIKLIFGVYFSSTIYNFIYIGLILLLSYILYKKLIDRYISSKIPLFHFYLGYIVIILSSNVLTLIRSYKYDLVVSSGISFFLLSLICILSINDNKRRNIIKLIIAGLSTGLIVLSKPTLIIYYPIILYFLVKIFLENKLRLKLLLIYIIPLTSLAVFQMFYNYIRFDSILEFGAKYQLTSFNMVNCMNFTIGKTFQGIIKYIFALPILNILEFPFFTVQTNPNSVMFNELCYQNRLVGLIAIPALWILLWRKNILSENLNFKKFKLLSLNKEQELSLLTYIILIVTVVSIILNANMGGICEVYSLDFKIILVFISIILWLKFISENISENENKAFLLMCVISIIIYIPISLTGESNLLSDTSLPLTNELKNLFEFWR